MLQSESLEPRIALHFDGDFYSDPPYLTLSFAPDGTDIGGRASRLHALMDAVAPRAAWQQSVIASFQTWAAQTNSDIAVVPDEGQPFGTVGATRRDPRFGDVRIGAAPLRRGVFAITIPRGPETGTWDGDVIFNSSVSWSSLEDVSRVALHEAGHVFGLGESEDPTSPMFYQGIPAVDRLSAADLDRLHAISGARGDDRNEPNDARDDATELFDDDDFDGSRPGLAYGDLLSGDVDYFQIELDDPEVDDYVGTLTVTVRTLGISTMQPTLSLQDRHGVVLAATSASRQWGDVISVTVPIDCASDLCGSYYAAVSSAYTDERGIGGFSVVATLDQAVTTPHSLTAAFADGRYRFLDPDDFWQVFAGDPATELPSLRDDLSQNDAPSSATPLETTAGYAEGVHYQAVGSLNPPQDADYYRWIAPDALDPGDRLRLVLEGLDSVPVTATVQIYDAQGAVVPAIPVIRQSGRLILQSETLQAGQEYLVRVTRSVNASPSGPGNYRFTSQFVPAAESFAAVAAGQWSMGTVSHEFTWQLRKPSLVIPAYAATPNSAPARNVDIELIRPDGTQMAHWQSTTDGYDNHPSLLLAAGNYRLRVRLTDGPWTSTDTARFDLRVAQITDPLAVPVRDPTQEPILELKVADVSEFTFPGVNPSLGTSNSGPLLPQPAGGPFVRASGVHGHRGRSLCQDLGRNGHSIIVACPWSPFPTGCE